MPYMPKITVSYTDKSPKENEDCGRCIMFKRPDRCSLVIGEVSKEGWCTEFERGRPAS